MRVVEIPQFGLEHLRHAERPDPSPGPGQVVVRIRAASLNFRDLMMAQGQYDPNLAKGRVPCSDGAGEVVAVGAGVTRVRAGDRVISSFCQNWHDGPLTGAKMRGALGGDIDGVLAERALLSEMGVVKLPAGYSFEEGATLPCAALTAWNALFGTYPGEAVVTPGETVLVQGTGGVSIFAMQLARAAGARVIVTSSSDDKLARARSMGAAGVINYKSTPDWDKAARDLTKGWSDAGGVDHVIEVGGAGTFNRSLRAVRSGGRISLIGVLAGVKGDIETVSILMRAVTVRGIYVGSSAMLAALCRGVEAHSIRPVIDRVFPFAEARAAFEHLKSGSHFGKVVIRVD